MAPQPTIATFAIAQLPEVDRRALCRRRPRRSLSVAAAPLADIYELRRRAVADYKLPA